MVGVGTHLLGPTPRGTDATATPGSRSTRASDGDAAAPQGRTVIVPVEVSRAVIWSKPEPTAIDVVFVEVQVMICGAISSMRPPSTAATGCAGPAIAGAPINDPTTSAAPTALCIGGTLTTR